MHVAVIENSEWVLTHQALRHGDYRTTATLGAGSSAEVFAAFHIPTLESIALKIPRANDSTSLLAEQCMIRESRVGLAVRHRNLLSIRGLERDDSGWPFLAMELLSGQTLHDAVLGGRPKSPHWIKRLFVQLCAGLSALHKAGFVHLDLSPNNIMIARDKTSPHGERVVILDYGLSAHLDDKQKTRCWSGTPGFVSPERLLSVPSHDAREDVYSLGALLYFAVERRLPFRSAIMHDAAAAAQDSAERQLCGDLEPLGKRALSQAVRPLIEAAFDSSLSGRPRSAADFGNRLEAALSPLLALPVLYASAEVLLN